MSFPSFIQSRASACGMVLPRFKVGPLFSQTSLETTPYTSPVVFFTKCLWHVLIQHSRWSKLPTIKRTMGMRNVILRLGLGGGGSDGILVRNTEIYC